MKKVMIFLGAFIVVFCISYIGLCYLVPELRIKLAAEPMVYFWESIRHMVSLKIGVSFIAGMLGAMILCGRKEKHNKLTGCVVETNCGFDK